MSGLEIAGLVIGTLGPLQQVIDLCHELHDRCKACKANPQTLGSLTCNYRKFREKVNALNAQYNSLAPHIPKPNRAIIEDHLQNIRRIIHDAHRILIYSSERLKRMPKALSFFRAVSIASECENLSRDFASADSLLSDVNIVLSNVAVTVETRSPTLRHLQHAPTKRKSDPLCATDLWRPSSIVSANPSDIVLDFNAKNSRNFAITPEGRVKALLLEGGSSLPITIAITGMSGVGKSCVLRALPHDSAIKDRFQDGFYCLSVGTGADKDTIIRQAINLVRITGGEATAIAMEKFPKVDNVLEKTAVWFQGKTWLLLVDDLCVGNGIGTMALSKLSQVLAAGRNSAIVFTTRDAQLAVQGTTHVQLLPKHPLSEESRRILLTCAKFHEEEVKESACEEAIQALLKTCSGLPVALAIVGRAASLQALTLGLQRSKAWACYVATLGDSDAALIRDGLEDYPNLSHTFSTALRVLEECKSARASFVPTQTYAEMHRALCVVRKQGWIPLCVLRSLWDLQTADQVGEVVRTLAEVNLVNRHFDVVDGVEVEGVVLHSLIHKFATDEANRRHQLVELHRELLNRISSTQEPQPGQYRGCREWWNFLDNDGYMFSNLSWHLIHAGKAQELLHLLLCPEWIAVQMELGGFLQLENDFKRLFSHVQDNPSDDIADPHTLKSLQIILEAAMLSSAYVFSNSREIWFQLHARLSKRATESNIMSKFLLDIERSATRPWIQPVNDCLTAPGGVLKCLITHRASIRCIDTLPDDDKIVCGCGDGSIVVFSTRVGVSTQKWKAHDDPVTSIITAVHGTRVVSCSADQMIKVWNAANGASIFNPLWVPDRATVLALSSDGRTLLSAGENEFVCVWDIRSGKFVRKVRTPHQGKVLCLAVIRNNSGVVTGGEDGTVQFWHSDTGDAMKPAMKGHSDAVVSIVVSADGERIVSGSKDGTARIWDARNSTLYGSPLLVAVGWVTCVTLTKNVQGESFVITGSSDTLVRLWKVDCEVFKPVRLRGHGESINDLRLSTSGQKVLSCSNDGLMGCIRAWDLDTAMQMGTSLAGHSLSVNCLAATPDGKRVVSGSGDKTVRIWDLETGKQVGTTLEGHSSWVAGVAITANGKRVVSVSYDKTIKIWDIETGGQVGGEALRGHESAITCLALSGDGRTLVTGSYKGGIIRVWDISDERRGFKTLQGHKRQVLWVYVSKDAERIISGSQDGTIRLWDIESAKCTRVIRNQECFHLSEQEAMSIVGEEYEDKIDITAGLRCRGSEIVCDHEEAPIVLGTMECSISSWIVVGKTLCIGASNGQVTFLELQT